MCESLSTKRAQLIIVCVLLFRPGVLPRCALNCCCRGQDWAFGDKAGFCCVCLVPPGAWPSFDINDKCQFPNIKLPSSAEHTTPRPRQRSRIRTRIANRHAQWPQTNLDLSPEASRSLEKKMVGPCWPGCWAMHCFFLSGYRNGG